MKFALKSKTVLASLMVILAMLALLLGDAGAVELSPEVRQMLQALAGIGGAASIYGRAKADSGITLSPKGE
tara:strand:+ start:326 stop:538 length:213 start_codon:yes stop_codon:yes gene_type:complete